MKYRLFGVAVVALLTSACDWKANVYPMTPQQVYDKLVAAPLPGEHGPFGKLDVSPSGEGNGIVRWASSLGTRFCEANIVPEGADKSRINVFCDGPGEGAATGMMQAMYRAAIIEHIDATLKGRPYDPRKALGETATLWPNDPRQADGSLGAAAGEALKMDQEMHQDIREGEAEQANATAEAAERAREESVHQDVNFKPGQPMVDVRK
jgi:hypothetical protein